VLVEDETANKTTTIIKSKNPGTSKNTMRARLVSDSAINVEPADGWDNYNTYIANNIELPDDIMQNNKHGEIGISFDLKSNGMISNIRVDQSDCNDCKELAKRLIEQGPQWKLKKGKKASAKVKVEF
jgi:outer membrane biosynthesis protein TonB